jgi:hypothetical protein
VGQLSHGDTEWGWRLCTSVGNCPIMCQHREGGGRAHVDGESQLVEHNVFSERCGPHTAVVRSAIATSLGSSIATGSGGLPLTEREQIWLSTGRERHARQAESVHH